MPGQSTGMRGAIPSQRSGERVPVPSPPVFRPPGAGYGGSRAHGTPAGVYGSSRVADHEASSDEESWSDSGQWAGGSGWTDDEPDSGGWSADDPGYSERRWTDEEPASYRRDDRPARDDRLRRDDMPASRRPAAVYGTPGRPETAPDLGRPDGGRPDGGRLDGGRPDGSRPDGSRPDGGRPDGGRPHKRRADVTAVDLGYTGRRTKPDHADAPDDLDDDGAYWRRIAADPDDW